MATPYSGSDRISPSRRPRAGVHRGEDGGDESGAVAPPFAAGQAPGQQADQRHHRRGEARDHAVRQRAVEAEDRGHGQEHRVERRVVGGLDVRVGVEPEDGADEAVALAECHRLVVEVEAVPVLGVVAVHADRVGEPKPEGHRGDDRQADVEAAQALSHVRAQASRPGSASRPRTARFLSWPPGARRWARHQVTHGRPRRPRGRPWPPRQARGTG